MKLKKINVLFYLTWEIIIKMRISLRE